MNYTILFFIIFLICNCKCHLEEPTTLPGKIEIESDVEHTHEPKITTEEVTFELINDIRKENGLSSLTWDPELLEVAKIRAEEASIK